MYFLERSAILFGFIAITTALLKHGRRSRTVFFQSSEYVSQECVVSLSDHPHTDRHLHHYLTDAEARSPSWPSQCLLFRLRLRDRILNNHNCQLSHQTVAPSLTVVLSTCHLTCLPHQRRCRYQGLFFCPWLDSYLSYGLVSRQDARCSSRLVRLGKEYLSCAIAFSKFCSGRFVQKLERLIYFCCLALQTIATPAPLALPFQLMKVKLLALSQYF